MSKSRPLRRLAGGVAALPVRLGLSDTALLVALSSVVGVGAGLVSLLIMGLANLASGLFFGRVASLLSFLGSGHVILLPALGGLAAALLMHTFARQRALPLPEEIESIHAVRNGQAQVLPALLRPLAAVLAIGGGGSAGFEGPIVQLSSLLAAALGQLFQLRQTMLVRLAAAGVAGGIAATFNAPLAGVAFALEIILGEFGVRTVAAMGAAAAGAAIVARLAAGEPLPLAIPSQAPALTIGALLSYIVLGLIAAVVAGVYVRLWKVATSGFAALNLPAYLKPALGGLLVGCVGFLVPQVFGSGTTVIGGIFQGNAVLAMLALMLIAKAAATALTIGSGSPGGMLTPALFLGVALGSGYGQIAQGVLTSVAPSANTYAAAAMAAVLAGAARAPFTAMLIGLELTQDYSIIIPLVIATITSTVLSYRLHTDALYTPPAQEGAPDVRVRRDLNLMGAIAVEEAMTPAEEVVTVSSSASLAELARLFQATAHHGFVVVDGQGNMVGLVTLADLERAIKSGRTNAVVGDICTRSVVTVFPDETLDDALRHLGGLDVGRIPVVDRRNRRRVLGMLRRSDIVRAYARALAGEPPSEEQRLAHQLQATPGAELVEVLLAAGDAAAGRQLKDVGLPATCVVVSIHRSGRVVIPRGNTQLLAGDRVVVLSVGMSAARVRAVLHSGPDLSAEGRN